MKRRALIGIAVIFLVLMIGVTGKAYLYMHDRHAKMASNEACARMQSIVPPNDIRAKPLCVYQIIPPSLGELFSGTPSLQPHLPASGCDQSATTTNCASIISQAPKAEPSATSRITWKTYTNNEIGLRFDYATNNPQGESWHTGNGMDGGRAFQMMIALQSGAVIQGYAFTKDYSTPKDGPGVDPEGYVIKADQYYVIDHGLASVSPFVPDEIWTSADGSKILITYGKNYDPSADYPEASVKALVNLPGPTFTGIGFVLYNVNSGGPHPASAEDLATFKRTLTSIAIIR